MDLVLDLPAGRSVVLAEAEKRHPQYDRTTNAQLGQCFGKGQPGPDGRCEIVYRIRPHVAQLTAPLPNAIPQQCYRCIRCKDAERQLEIIELVEDAESLIAAVEHLLMSATRRAHHLRSAILGSAFSGRLLPQDPSDEPASVLLDRIAAERSASNGRRRSTNRLQGTKATT